MDKFEPLPADLPENWQTGEIVSPQGTDVGLTPRHGYNYLMHMVNLSHQSLNLLGPMIESGIVLKGHGDPTEETVGSKGQLYLNEDTGKLWMNLNGEYPYQWGNAGGGGSLGAQLIVTVPSDSVVTCTKGTTVLTQIAVDNTAKFDLPEYGKYTLQATLAGQESNTVTVNVEEVKLYKATLSYFQAILTVTAETGASITIAGPDGYSETKNADSSGKAAFTLGAVGAYTAKATKDTGNSSTANINVIAETTSYTTTVTFCKLNVNVADGAQVTVSKGSTTYTRYSTGATMTFYLPETGTWAVQASLNGRTVSSSQACPGYQAYTITLTFTNVFGVSWARGSSTALTRLTKASDPLGVVTQDITSNPVPAVGTGSGSSPFDNFAPWKDIAEYNVENNSITVKRGQSGFSTTNKDTVVWIPEFYIRTVVNGGSLNFYVADGPMDGFVKHPGSGRFMARYETGNSGGYVTRSGLTPQVNMTRATARTQSHAKGSKWYQRGYAGWGTLWYLYLVEFADWNSQAKIGRGYVDGNSAAIKTGGTDAMTYHTGRAAGTDGKTAVQYRWVENPWGNIWEWVDGANFNNRRMYYCTNPANYADDTTTNYTDSGMTLPNSGWPTNIADPTAALQWAYAPGAIGGSDSTYIPDYVHSPTGWRVLDVGGSWDSGSYAGLFYFSAYYDSSSAYSGVGSRLEFEPDATDLAKVA